MKNKKIEKNGSEEHPKCSARLCEHPITGELFIVRGKGCPPGYLERIAGKIATKGLKFVDEEDWDFE
jgi:hypothetical protein